MPKFFLVAFAIAASSSFAAPAVDNAKPEHSRALADARHEPTASGTAQNTSRAEATAEGANRAVQNVASAAASTAAVPNSPAVNPREGNASTSDRTAAEGKEGFTISGLYVKVSDLAMVLVTLLLAVFTFALWLATWGLFKEARSAGLTAEKSATAALESARVAGEMVNAMIARESARWIVAGMGMQLNAIARANSGYTGVLTVDLKNIGRSDAEVVSTAVKTAFGKISPEPDYGGADVVDASSFGNTVRAAWIHQIRLPITGHIGLTETQARACNNGEPMWLYGYIRYRDYLNRMWVTGFIGQVTSSVNWFPYRGAAGDDTGGGAFLPVASNVGADAYTYTRLEDE
ncbi:hypothetical protein M3A49_01035 [Paraburkholderia sp. CNPSo 3076]|nr:hypothetical protein [Paraburkholderia sp. CNPSo 3076]